MATKSAAAKTTATADPVASLATEREGAFIFTTATALHDAHVAVRPAPVSAKAPAAQVSRERFTEDEQLISFINANGWADLKTQKVLDSIRAQGRACGMARLNKLLGRDSKGNPIATVEAAKGE